MHRRDFLRTTALTAAASIAGRSESARAETPQVPSPAVAMPSEVIDTHTHFYDPTRPEGVPWPGKGDPALYRPMLPETFRKLVAPLGVTGTVVVEASPWVEDNQWLLDLAGKNPFLVGIVGNLAPGGEKFADHLQRFAKNPLYRGFRISGHGLAKNLERPEFVADLKRVIDRDLEVDINGGPAMLPEIALLARQLPELRIVINHVANVRNDGKQVDAEWKKGMQECAAGPHVFCKVSALAEGATRKDASGKAPLDTAYYVPLLDAIWEIWGEKRLIFGSNWPVSERAAGYADVIRVVRDYFAGKGGSAMKRFFAENARTAYQWAARPR